MLDSNTLESIYTGLKSYDTNELLDTLDLVQDHIPDLGSDQKGLLADGIMSLFYLDEVENPGYVEVFDAASDILAQIGSGVIEVLIGGMVGGDLHAEYHIAQTLGRIGKPAIKALKEKFRDKTDPTGQGLALFALSSIDDPALIEIFDEVISMLDSEHAELRDAAAGAVGTMVDCIGGLCLAPDAINIAFEKLFTVLSDSHVATRSKAVRSIGKLAEKEYLSEEQKGRMLPVIRRILGIDGKHQWDSAFIVRREAEDAYYFITGEKASSVSAESICNTDDRQVSK
ncbi:MAG: hypothetical protein NTY09_06515 [bacterium]|nr:hypothetical protein [bacterium]